MTTQVFTSEATAQAYITGLAEPYHRWDDIGRIVVTTGADITATPVRMLQPYQLRDRFTQAEMDAITIRAYSALGDVNMQSILLLLQTAVDGIRMDDARLTDGLSYIQACGIISASRKAEILA